MYNTSVICMANKIMQKWGYNTCKWLLRWYNVNPFKPITLNTDFGVASANSDPFRLSNQAYHSVQCAIYSIVANMIEVQNQLATLLQTYDNLHPFQEFLCFSLSIMHAITLLSTRVPQKTFNPNANNRCVFLIRFLPQYYIYIYIHAMPLNWAHGDNPRIHTLSH